MKPIGFVFNVLLSVALVRCCSVSSDPSERTRFRNPTENDCIPDDEVLNVILANGVRLDRCSITDCSLQIAPQDFEERPKLIFFPFAELDITYTLVIHSFTVCKDNDVLESIVTGIPGRNLRTGVWEGEERVEYQKADCSEGSKQVHQFLLYEEFNGQNVLVPDDRENFNPEFFLQQQPDTLNGPVAMQAVQTQEFIPEMTYNKPRVVV